MRLGPASQQALALSKQRRESVRVLIEDAEGTMVDRSAWFVDGSIRDSVEQFGPSASLNFHRERNGDSLSPRVTDYLAPSRKIDVKLALSELGTAPDAGDWQTLFRGVMDEPSWGGDESRLRLTCRSELSALLHDRWVEQPFVVPELPLIQAMQFVLDTVLGVSAPMVYVEGDPDSGVPEYQQRRQSLMDALRALVQPRGWLVREVWHDATASYRLTVYDPERNRQTADFGFSDSDYYSIDNIQESSRGVRSVVRVQWAEDQFVVAEDTEAIEKYGRKVIYIDARSSPFITTRDQALFLAGQALLDVSLPLATQQPTHHLDYRIEVGDIYTWLPNGIHASETLQLAVSGWEHRLTGDPRTPSTTSIMGRERPTGGSWRWYEEDERTRTRDDLGITPETPTPIVPGAGQAAWFYTTKEGDRGFDADSTPSESSGRYVSRTLVGDGINQVFRPILPGEASAGTVLYRTLALVYQGAAPQEAGRIYLSHDISSSDISYEVALEPGGFKDLRSDDPQMGESVDQETAPDPLTGTLSWSSPVGVDAGLETGDVEQSTVLGVHLKLTVTADAVTIPVPPDLCFSVCVPEESEA